MKIFCLNCGLASNNVKFCRGCGVTLLHKKIREDENDENDICYGYPSLLEAVSKNLSESLIKLIIQEKGVKIRDSLGNTALHLLNEECNENIIDLLINSGLSTLIKNEKGEYAWNKEIKMVENVEYYPSEERNMLIKK